jgi:hypothetical protein
LKSTASFSNSGKQRVIWSRMSPTTPKRRPATKKKQAPIRRKERRVALWSAALAAVLALGTLLGYLALIPRVTATVSDPLDQNDPFSSTITIQNSGYIPLRSVRVNLGINYITFMSRYGTPKTIIGQERTGTEVSYANGPPRDLGMDERFTVSLNDAFSTNNQGLIAAQITIIVQYRWPLIGVRREKRFPLTAKRMKDGSFRWFAEVWPRPN